MRIKDAKWEMTDDAIGMRPRFRVWCKECFWAYVERKIDEDMDMEGYGDCATYSEDIGYTSAFERGIAMMQQGEFDMPLREVHCTRVALVGPRAFANNMHYKCCSSHGCDKVKVFGVPIDKEYYEELVRRRKGQERITPTEEWDANEDLRKQLQGLGYI